MAKLYTMLNAISAGIGAIARSRRGNVAMIFGFALMPMLIAVGSAIDYSMAARSRNHIATSADAAALSATKAAQNYMTVNGTGAASFAAASLLAQTAMAQTFSANQTSDGYSQNVTAVLVMTQDQTGIPIATVTTDGQRADLLHADGRRPHRRGRRRVAGQGRGRDLLPDRVRHRRVQFDGGRRNGAGHHEPAERQIHPEYVFIERSGSCVTMCFRVPRSERGQHLCEQRLLLGASGRLFLPRFRSGLLPLWATAIARTVNDQVHSPTSAHSPSNLATS